MRRILHISADYPDAVAPAKTRAIAALVEGTADRFDHRVFSLNRRGGIASFLKPGAVDAVTSGAPVASWRYAAPSGGLFLRTAMERVGDAILAEIRKDGMRPDLVQGHKLSFEGIAARHVARRLGVPYALTLQGNTDQRVIGIRRDLRALYRRIWQEAGAVIAFAPWIGQWCENTLGPRSTPPTVIPCVPVRDETLAPAMTPPIIGTAFHLTHWRNKNLQGLARACALLDLPGVRLEVAGGGDKRDEAAVDAAIAEAGAGAMAARIGAIAPDAIQRWMNGRAVFAMPSHRESFGMVFIEALLAGCPIIYPRGAAVDGYFDGAPFARGVDAHDPADIAAALKELLHKNAECKAALADWQASDAAARFRRSAILEAYTAVLDKSFAP
jgi:glycosyltransferase involved in cell wall biosynthesis